MALFHLLF